MQLRVARLCLDCEELHTDNSCPVCASDRYAFLSTWLPSEERRRWRRTASIEPAAPDSPLALAVESVSRWFRGDAKKQPITSPLTRRSDHVLPLNFNGSSDPESTPPRAVEPSLSKRDA